MPSADPHNSENMALSVTTIIPGRQLKSNYIKEQFHNPGRRSWRLSTQALLKPALVYSAIRNKESYFRDC
jgi:hypothetical protein